MRVISVHVKLYLCVAGTRVRARPHVGRWWVKMPGPFFNPSPSLFIAMGGLALLLLSCFSRHVTETFMLVGYVKCVLVCRVCAK